MATPSSTQAEQNGTKRDKTGQNGTQNTTALSERQLATLPYLVASPSISEGARLADVGRATLERMRSEAADLARTELPPLQEE